MAEVDHETPERHASWTELFFDLVVVAGVGQLAHLLAHGDSLSNVGLYVLLYLAFWISWATYTVYGNVQGDQARLRTMLLAMLGLAVMAAAVPGIRDTHTRAFVIAYVALRWLAGLIYGRGEVVVDWPLAQYGTGALPWLISLFAADSARYWLWTLGIAIDLFAMLAVSGNNMLASAQQRLDKVLRRRRPPPGRAPVTIQAAHTEAAHLAERMALFVIIVLGEGVIQVITTAADFSVWNFPLDAVALGAFAILVGLWTLSLRYGFAGVPGLESSAIPTRFALTLHCVTTGALAALAAGLGEAVAHTGETLPDQTRWLLCGGIAAYFVISTIGGIIAGTTRSWLFGALPCLIGSVVLGVFGRKCVPAGWSGSWSPSSCGRSAGCRSPSGAHERPLHNSRTRGRAYSRHAGHGPVRLHRQRADRRRRGHARSRRN